MNEHVDVMCQVRESFSGLRMEMPLENVFARSRAHRRRRRAAMTAAAAGAAGAAAALTLTLGGAAPVHSGNPPRLGAGATTLTAFSVTSGPGDRTTLILHKGPPYVALDPSALRQALAQHGIPALVTVDTFCRPANGAEVSLDQVLHPATLLDGSAEMVIDGSAMPPGTELSIGYYSSSIRMALIEDGATLSCSSSTSGQPAVRLTPAGAKVR